MVPDQPPEEKQGQACSEQGGKSSEELSDEGGGEATDLIIIIIIIIIFFTMISGTNSNCETCISSSVPLNKVQDFAMVDAVLSSLMDFRFLSKKIIFLLPPSPAYYDFLVGSLNSINSRRSVPDNELKQHD